MARLGVDSSKRSSDSAIFKLAPSKYGMFVSMNCGLYLRRASMIDKKDNSERSTISERMQLRGCEWEVRICNYLQAQCSIDRSQAYTDCTNKDFGSILRSKLNENSAYLVHHFYQVTLNVDSSSLLSSLRESGVTISKIIPDLFELRRENLSGPWVLTVIDAKSSLRLKESHQAQVITFCMELH